MQCAKPEAKHTCGFIAFSANSSTQRIEFLPTTVTSPRNNFSYSPHIEPVKKTLDTIKGGDFLFDNQFLKLILRDERIICTPKISVKQFRVL